MVGLVVLNMVVDSNRDGMYVQIIMLHVVMYVHTYLKGPDTEVGFVAKAQVP